MRRAQRFVLLATATSLLLSILPAAPVLARGDRLKFNKPVDLSSFSPLRTAVGAVYSADDDEEQSDHEWSAEPVIGVDKKGVIYIGGTCCIVAASPVWASFDGGKEFVELESPGHVREWGIGAEGDIEVDDEGNMYFVDTYIPGLLSSKWSDNGKTWEFTAPASGVIPGFDDRPWLAYSKQALYLYVNHVSHTQIYSSTDGGLTYTSEGPLSWDGSISGQPYFPGHIAADRKRGTLWVAGLVGSGSGKNETIGSTVSTDGGQTFTEAVVTNPQREGGFSPIFTATTAVDAAGNGYVTWSTYDKDGCDVYYASSTNLGKSWNKPVRVSDGRGCATFPWIVAGDDGKIALAWYQTPKVRRETATQRFLRALTSGTTVYGGIEIPDFSPQDELAPDAPWYLHAAVIPNATAKQPQVLEERVRTKSPVLLGPMGRELWDFLQLDIGPDGRVHITYAEKFKDSAPQTWYVSSRSGPRLR
jgi:hypothetical protein